VQDGGEGVEAVVVDAHLDVQRLWILHPREHVAEVLARRNTVRQGKASYFGEPTLLEFGGHAAIPPIRTVDVHMAEGGDAEQAYQPVIIGTVFGAL